MNKEVGMFLMHAEFDSELGYVKSVSNTVNPEASRPCSNGSNIQVSSA